MPSSSRVRLSPAPCCRWPPAGNCRWRRACRSFGCLRGEDPSRVENDEFYVFAVRAWEFLADGDESCEAVGGVSVVNKEDGRVGSLASVAVATDPAVRVAPNPAPDADHLIVASRPHCCALLAGLILRVIGGGLVADQVSGAVRLQEQGDVPVGAGARAALGLR